MIHFLSLVLVSGSIFSADPASTSMTDSARSEAVAPAGGSPDNRVNVRERLVPPKAEPIRISASKETDATPRKSFGLEYSDEWIGLRVGVWSKESPDRQWMFSFGVRTIAQDSVANSVDVSRTGFGISPRLDREWYRTAAGPVDFVARAGASVSWTVTHETWDNSRLIESTQPFGSPVRISYHRTSEWTYRGLFGFGTRLHAGESLSLLAIAEAGLGYTKTFWPDLPESHRRAAGDFGLVDPSGVLGLEYQF